MSMKYVDEYRDPELAKHIAAEIDRLSEGKSLKFMEVCGGHTHTIYKHGIEDVLPLQHRSCAWTGLSRLRPANGTHR